MIAAVGSVPAANGLAAEVHRRSGGNAYFVEELVAAVAEGASGVPQSLRDAVLARELPRWRSESILALAVGVRVRPMCWGMWAVWASRNCRGHRQARGDRAGCCE